MTDKPLDENSKHAVETSDSSSASHGPAEESSENGDSLHAKRGRMITAGIVATIVLAVVAILVAGIFQLTSRWVMVCPRDLPVNDPAPILWQMGIADKTVAAPLGVPKNIISSASFKGSPQEGSEEKAK